MFLIWDMRFNKIAIMTYDACNIIVSSLGRVVAFNENHAIFWQVRRKMQILSLEWPQFILPSKNDQNTCLIWLNLFKYELLKLSIVFSIKQIFVILQVVQKAGSTLWELLRRLYVIRTLNIKLKHKRIIKTVALLRLLGLFSIQTTICGVEYSFYLYNLRFYAV